jgi:hypothetical protein
MSQRSYHRSVSRRSRNFNGLNSPPRVQEPELYRVTGTFAYPGGPFVPIPVDMPRFNFSPRARRQSPSEFRIPSEMKHAYREWYINRK